MEKQTIERFLNRTVKIQLRNNNVYTLVIKNFTDFDLTAIDKFNNEVTISISDIIVIEGVFK